MKSGWLRPDLERGISERCKILAQEMKRWTDMNFLLRFTHLTN
jgi:hypothetical protein